MRFISWLRDFFTRSQTEDRLSPPEEEPVEVDDLDPFNPFPEPVQIEITDVIDLHTIRPRDVKRVLEEYLFQAHDKGFRHVRIIHGKGIGTQREIVRTTLARTPFVEDWTNAPQEAGGWGATLVRFSLPRIS